MAGILDSSESGPTSSSSDDVYSEITGKLWTVYRVSPLFNFKYTTVSLKKYALRLKQYLTDIQADPDKGVSYDVYISVLPNLITKRSQFDSQPIKVEVTKLSNEQTRIGYIGVLLSCGATEESLQEGFIKFPFLLGAGTTKLVCAVHDKLCKFFDCSISKINFNQHELMRISSFYLGDTGFNFQIEYIMPNCNPSSKITLDMPTREVIKLWHCIKLEYHSIDPTHCNSEYEKYELFYKGLIEHTLCTFYLDLKLCQIKRIKSPSVTVSMDGRIRLTTDKIGQVLGLLHKIASETSFLPTIHTEP